MIVILEGSDCEIIDNLSLFFFSLLLFLSFDFTTFAFISL